MNVASTIKSLGVLPIVRLENVKNAGKLAQALKRAELPLAEVVFRTKDADKAIAGMKEAWPEMTLGAGTVLTTEQIERAAAAGATFILSPGTDPEIIDASAARGLLPIPGCATATDVQMSVKHGVSLVKFFPAGLMGGTAAINALAAPFPQVQFIPTNGVGFPTLSEYAANPHVAACAGIYPCPDALIAVENWDEISRLCEKARRIVEAVRACVGALCERWGRPWQSGSGCPSG